MIIQHFLFFYTVPHIHLLVYGGKNVMVTWPWFAFHSLAYDNMVHHMAWQQLRQYSVHLTTHICTEDNEINSDDGISWMIRWQWWRMKCFQDEWQSKPAPYCPKLLITSFIPDSDLAYCILYTYLRTIWVFQSTCDVENQGFTVPTSVKFWCTEI